MPSRSSTMLPSTRALLERQVAEHPVSAAEPAVAASAAAPSGTVPNVVGVHLLLERDGQVRLGRWEGVPRRREPEKCVAWRWWNAEDLPESLVPYARAAIEGVRAGRGYTELGWGR